MDTLNGFVTRKLENALKSAFSGQMKRMCLLASLTANLRNEYRLDHDLLKTLNDTMSLVKSEDSLLIPVIMSKKIWHDRLKDFELIRDLLKACDWSKDQVNKICSAILELIPSWLWYGDRKVVAGDVELLLRHHKTVLCV